MLQHVHDVVEQLPAVAADQDVRVTCVDISKSYLQSPVMINRDIVCCFVYTLTGLVTAELFSFFVSLPQEMFSRQYEKANNMLQRCKI